MDKKRFAVLFVVVVGFFYFKEKIWDFIIFPVLDYWGLETKIRQKAHVKWLWSVETRVEATEIVITNFCDYSFQMFVLFSWLVIPIDHA